MPFPEVPEPGLIRLSSAQVNALRRVRRRCPGLNRFKSVHLDGQTRIASYHRNPERYVLVEFYDEPKSDTETIKTTRRGVETVCHFKMIERG
jgi:hypothetical protein